MKYYYLYLDSPYKTVAEKEEQKKKNFTKLKYIYITHISRISIILNTV